jgi:hypothetical protein
MFLTDRQLRYLSSITNSSVPISGEFPEVKVQFLVLSLAVGMQLAEDYGLEDVTGTIHPGNYVTSGEVEVYGTDTWTGLVVRFRFFQPELSSLLWVNGEEGEAGFSSFTAKMEPFAQILPVTYDGIVSYDRERAWIFHWLQQSASQQRVLAKMNSAIIDETLAGNYDEPS